MTGNRVPGTQAKRIMDTNPGQSVKETAYELGFPDTANFCRYFKRATGIYPQAYKKMVMADRHAKNLHQKASTART